MENNEKKLTNKEKIKKLQDMWNADSKIDRLTLVEDLLINSNLNSKYVGLYASHREAVKYYENKLYKERLFKHEYYTGKSNYEALKERNLEPFGYKILKSEVEMYINADDDIIRISDKKHFHETMVKMLDSILWSIKDRGKSIIYIIEWEKHSNGI